MIQKWKKIPRNRNVLKQRSSLFVLATTRGISSQKLVDYYPIGVQKANMHEDFATCVSPFDIITATITTVVAAATTYQF